MKLTKLEKHLIDTYAYIFDKGGDINDFIKHVLDDDNDITADYAADYDDLKSAIVGILVWFDEDPSLHPYDELNEETVNALDDKVFYTTKKVINNKVTTRSLCIRGKNLEEVYFPKVVTIQEGDCFTIGDNTAKIKKVSFPNLVNIKDEAYTVFARDNAKSYPKLIEVEMSMKAAQKLLKNDENRWLRDKIKWSK